MPPEDKMKDRSSTPASAQKAEDMPDAAPESAGTATRPGAAPGHDTAADTRASGNRPRREDWTNLGARG